MVKCGRLIWFGTDVGVPRSGSGNVSVMRTGVMAVRECVIVKRETQRWWGGGLKAWGDSVAAAPSKI